MAADAGINLNNLTGSGPGGRIVKRDIEAAMKGGTAQPQAQPQAQPEQPSVQQAPAQQPAVQPAGGAAPVLAPDAPPILVIGNTGDAVTPYAAAEEAAARLSHAALLTYDGEGHTSFGWSVCLNRALTDYLIDLRLPEAGTVCR